jgi:hypothetical protein
MIFATKSRTANITFNGGTNFLTYPSDSGKVKISHFNAFSLDKTTYKHWGL